METTKETVNEVIEETIAANEVKKPHSDAVKLGIIKSEVIEQELYGEHVRRIGNCAVVKVDDVKVAMTLPFTYTELVQALVKRKYDADRSEAVTANYLMADDETLPAEKRDEYKAEYAAYKEWRMKVKAVAKEVTGVEG